MFDDENVTQYKDCISPYIFVHVAGIFKFLDEYYESLKRESQQEEERKEAMLGRSDVRTSLSDRGKDRSAVGRSVY